MGQLRDVERSAELMRALTEVNVFPLDVELEAFDAQVESECVSLSTATSSVRDLRSVIYDWTSHQTFNQRCPF